MTICGPCRNVKPLPWRSVIMCCAGGLLSFPLMKCPEGASPFSGHCSLFPSPLYRGSSGPAYWHFSFPSRKRPEIRLCVIGKLNCLSLLFVINSIQTGDGRCWVLTLYYCSPTFLKLAQDKCLRVIPYIPLQFSTRLPPPQLFFCSLIILLRAFGIWSKKKSVTGVCVTHYVLQILPIYNFANQILWQTRKDSSCRKQDSNLDNLKFSFPFWKSFSVG